jgi:maltose-binding protein MalE
MTTSTPSARPTRRTVLGRGLSGGATLAGALALAACGQSAQSGPAGQGAPGANATPTEVLWATYTPPSDVRAEMWNETWRQASKATGLKITVVEETSATAWQKRQTELAAGTTSTDITYNQLNWVIGGGLQGMFVEHGELMRRDKVDPKQYYKAELDSWAWKGKQWGIPFATGGETVLYNKKLFDAKGVKYPYKDWTFDDLLDACRKLNDPANGKFAIFIGQNGIHYMLGTFLLNFGGKRLSDAKDKALYGDDPKSIQGAELNVDLHRRYGFPPPPRRSPPCPRGAPRWRWRWWRWRSTASSGTQTCAPPSGPRTWTSPRPPRGRAGRRPPASPATPGRSSSCPRTGTPPGKPCAGSTPARGCSPPRSRPSPGPP